MTYSARETSRFLGHPFELYLFQTSSKAWPLTSGDIARTYDGREYTPESLLRSDIEQNEEAQAGSVKVSIPRTHEIARLFVGSLPSTPISLVIYRGHEGDPDGEIVVGFSGEVATAEFEEQCQLNCTPEQEVLKRRIPVQSYGPQCPWVIFSEECGVDRAGFQETATVSAVAGDTVTASEFATHSDGWFTYGWIEKGGERRMIVSHVGTTVKLLTGLAGLEVGDTITAYAGCRGNRTDCKNKFDNIGRFWGFDRIPYHNPFDGVA